MSIKSNPIQSNPIHSSVWSLTALPLETNKKREKTFKVAKSQRHHCQSEQTEGKNINNNRSIWPAVTLPIRTYKKRRKTFTVGSIWSAAPLPIRTNKKREKTFKVANGQRHHCQSEQKTRPDTQLPNLRVGGQGPYLRSPDQLGRSSEVKEIKS